MRRFCQQLPLLLPLILLALPFSSDGLEGALLFLQVSNNRLVTDSHYLPPTVPDGDSQLQQQIVGSLSGLCQSCPPGAVTALPFKRGALRVLAVLADNTLSVVLVDQISHDVIQVINLDEMCVPRRLVKLGDSTTNSFAVFCANQSLQVATIDVNHHVTLTEVFQYDTPNNNASVFITSGSQLRIVTYTGEGKVQLYTVGNLSPETLQLPSNINCTSHPTLHPLHTRDAFLLHCMTESGAVLYVVPVPVSADVAAQSVPADGLPYSSQDGTHILVVDGPQVTIYSSADTSATGTVKRLPSEITSVVVNLDSDNVRLLTETGEHVVMNLKNSLSEPRYMPGGPPVLSEWVDSSNHYLYITKSSTLYVVNETSTQPQYEPKYLTNTPEMMLFLEGVKPTEVPPTTSPTSAPPDDTNEEEVDFGERLGTESFVGFIIGMFLGSICCCWCCVWCCFFSRVILGSVFNTCKEQHRDRVSKKRNRRNVNQSQNEETANAESTELASSKPTQAAASDGGETSTAGADQPEEVVCSGGKLSPVAGDTPESLKEETTV